MKNLRAVLLAVSLAMDISADPTAFASDLPENTRYLSEQELFKMYVNRSWIWSDGAGYYRNKQRKFTAYSNENGAASIATGMWFLPWKGKVCFRARWQGPDYNVKKTSCFGHRMSGDGTIWQRREPDGKWYVFRNNPRMSGDEFNKLIFGDHVAKGYLRNETAIKDQ